MLDSTFHLLDKLKEFSPSPNQIMISFDVVSVFTNVPLEGTIDMIANYIYTENNKKAAFKKGEKAAFNSCHYLRFEPHRDTSQQWQIQVHRHFLGPKCSDLLNCWIFLVKTSADHVVRITIVQKN